MSISKIKVGSTEHDLHASKLTTARTITLSGDVSGSTTFDGSGNVTITTTVADDSHNHVISNVDGLQTALNGKLEKNTSGGVASCIAAGEYMYFKIATIKIISTYVNRPIVFEISSRGRSFSVVTIEFLNENNIDPGLSFFISNYDNCFYIKKTATSTWEVYGQYNEIWGDCTLHRITGCGADGAYIDVTVNMTNIASLPSGCTQVVYGGNVGYATKATQDVNGNVITSTYAKKSHKHSVTAAGTNSSTSITPAGTVSQPTFTGTAASHNHTFTGTAAEHTHTFTGTEKTASVKYTPAGTVSSSFTGTAHNHTFSGTPAKSGIPDTTNVTTIYSITGVGTLPSASLSSGTLPSCSYTAPSLTASVSNQCLTISLSGGSHSFSAGAFPTLTFSAGTLPTREAVSIPNTNHTHSVTATGTIGNATAGGSVSSTFAGTEATISHTFTPAGSISKTSLTPAGTISSKELTPAGTVSKPTFTGTAASHTHTFTGSAVNSATES